MSTEDRKPFWLDVSQPRLGTCVVFATDEFFGAKERLISPAEPVFLPDKYDEHGKWMDGWETRRRRGPGHDYCIIRLGRRSRIDAFEIDTRHFTGNFPSAASVDVFDGELEYPDADADWHQAVPVTELAGDSRRLLSLEEPLVATHVRLHIYPDGGIARLRVWGRVLFDPALAGAGQIDLAAMEHGGRAVATNDCHFGDPANLIAPGRPRNMGDGWETRRRRTPGHDWVVLELATPGRVSEIVVDTAHFKGNYPDRFSLQAACASDEPDSLLVVRSQFWDILMPEQPLKPDSEQRFTRGLRDTGPVTHVRFNIFPDGGVGRLRLLGLPSEEGST